MVKKGPPPEASEGIGETVLPISVTDFVGLEVLILRGIFSPDVNTVNFPPRVL